MTFLFLTYLIYIFSTSNLIHNDEKHLELLNFKQLKTNKILDYIISSDSDELQKWNYIKNSTSELLDSMNRKIINANEEYVDEYKGFVVHIYHKYFKSENIEKKVSYYIDKIFEPFYSQSLYCEQKFKQEIISELFEFYLNICKIKKDFRMTQYNKDTGKNTNLFNKPNFEKEEFVKKLFSNTYDENFSGLKSENNENQFIDAAENDRFKSQQNNELHELGNVNLNKNTISVEKEEAIIKKPKKELYAISNEIQNLKYVKIFDAIKNFQLKLIKKFQNYNNCMREFVYNCYESGYHQFDENIFNNIEKYILEYSTSFTETIEIMTKEIQNILDLTKKQLIYDILLL